MGRRQIITGLSSKTMIIRGFSVLFMMGITQFLQASVPLYNVNGFIPNFMHVTSIDGKVLKNIHTYYYNDGLVLATTNRGLSMFRIFFIDSTAYSIRRVDMDIYLGNRPLQLDPKDASYKIDSSYFIQFYYPQFPDGKKTYPIVQIVYNIGDSLRMYVKVDSTGLVKVDWWARNHGLLSKLSYLIKGAYDVKIKENELVIYFEKDDYVVQKEPIVSKDGNIIPCNWTLEKISDTYYRAKIEVPHQLKDKHTNSGIYVDPPVVWSTLLGGGNRDNPPGVFSDGSHVWICGSTLSINFPTQTYSGAYIDTVFNGGYDAYVGCFRRSDFSLKWLTFYGGTNDDYFVTLWSDTSSIWIGGFSNSTDFPLQAPPGSGFFQSSLNGGYDAVLVRFDSSGARLWATYLGGPSGEVGAEPGMFVHGYKDSVYYIFLTTSTSMLPITGSPPMYIQTSLSGSRDAYIFAIRGSTYVPFWSTYIGGSSGDEHAGGPVRIFVDENYVWVTIRTSASTFPTLNYPGAYYQPSFGGGTSDGTIVKFTHEGEMLWSTYFGVGGNDYFTGIYSNGYQLFLGGTTDSDFSSIIPGWGNGHQGSNDGIVVSFDTSGAFLWGFNYGSPGDENMHAMSGFPCGAVLAGHGSGGLYITPTVSDSIFWSNSYYQPTPVSPGFDGFILWTASNGQVIWATFWDNGSTDFVPNNAIHYDGDYAFFSGFNGGGLPIYDAPTGGYLDTTPNGGQDGFIVAFDFPDPLLFDSVEITPPQNCYEPYLIKAIYKGGFTPFVVWYKDGAPIDTTDSIVIFPDSVSHTVTLAIIDTFCRKEIYPLDTIIINPIQYVAVDTVIDLPSCKGSRDGTITLLPTSTNVIAIWNTGDTTLTLSNIDSGLYIAYLIDTLTSCQDTMEFLISWRSALNIIDKEATLLQCSPPLYSYSVVTANGVPPIVYIWNDSLVTTDNTFIAPYGIVQVVVTDSLCYDTITFYTSPPPYLNLYVTPTIDTIEWGEEANIYVYGDINGIASYNWTIASGDYGSIPSSLSPVVSPDTTTIYIITIKDSMECEFVDTVTIYVEYVEKLFIPDAFSPNNDGINDVFRLHGKGIVEIEWKIYNRWGVVVFQGNSLTDFWDGTYNGHPQDVDAYVVVGTAKFITGKTQKFRKPILLIR